MSLGIWAFGRWSSDGVRIVGITGTVPKAGKPRPVGQQGVASRRRTRSASPCSATPSWAGPIRVRFRRGPTTSAQPTLRPDLVSVSGRDRERVVAMQERYGWHEAVTDWREQVSDRPRRAVRQRWPERAARASRRSRPSGTASTCCARSRSGSTRPSPTGCGPRRSRAGVQHMCGFNYRFVPAVRLRPGDPRGGRDRRRRSLPRHVPAELGLGGRREHLALRSRPRPGPARSAISAPTSSTSRATSSATSHRSPHSFAPIVPGREVDDHFVADDRVRERRRRHARGIAPGSRAGSTTTRSR